jgi:hypothetical protein
MHSFLHELLPLRPEARVLALIGKRRGGGICKTCPRKLIGRQKYFLVIKIKDCQDPVLIKKIVKLTLLDRKRI